MRDARWSVVIDALLSGNRRECVVHNIRDVTAVAFYDFPTNFRPLATLFAAYVTTCAVNVNKQSA